MSKRMLILMSIGIFIVTAALVAGGLFLWKHYSEKDQASPPPVATTPQPGDSVELSQVPDYQSCKVMSKDVLAAVDEEKITSVSEGTPAGVIAPNRENAQVCSYTLKTAKSDAATLTASVYLYAPMTDGTNPNELDDTWGNVSKGIYGYKLSYPAYFKPTDNDANRDVILHIIDGPRTFRFTLSQPKDARFDDTETLKLLLAIANKADYKAAAANLLQSDDN